MVAYSFKARFGPLIASRAKTQTVRSDRKRHARAGETLQLFTGMRTRQCRLIGTATCQAVSPVRFDFNPGSESLELYGVQTRAPADLDAFARRDGFADWVELKAFWAAEHPGLSVFSGWLIEWLASDLVVTP